MSDEDIKSPYDVFNIWWKFLKANPRGSHTDEKISQILDETDRTDKKLSKSDPALGRLFRRIGAACLEYWAEYKGYQEAESNVFQSKRRK